MKYECESQTQELWFYDENIVYPDKKLRYFREIIRNKFPEFSGILRTRPLDHLPFMLAHGQRSNVLFNNMASSSSSVTRSTSEQPDILPTQNTRSDKTSATKVPTREENGTSRPEILCKLVAALLVLFFVVFHLVRVLRDGESNILHAERKPSNIRALVFLRAVSPDIFVCYTSNLQPIFRLIIFFRNMKFLFTRVKLVLNVPARSEAQWLLDRLYPMRGPKTKLWGIESEYLCHFRKDGDTYSTWSTSWST